MEQSPAQSGVAARPRGGRWRWWAVRLSVAFVLGVVASVVVALVGAALRPDDGYPNVVGKSLPDFGLRGVLPNFRERVPSGDVYVTVYGTRLHTVVRLGPRWLRRPDDPSEKMLPSSYPYPEDITDQMWKLFGGVQPCVVPYWASRCAAQSSEYNLVTVAWGWPCRCLRGVEHIYVTYGPDGQMLRSTSKLEGYWERGSAKAGTRFRRIPMVPIWLGLVANAGAYMWPLLLLMVAAGLPRWLRTRRERRHRCAACGYDLARLPDGAVCPECGSARGRAVAIAP